MGNKKENKKPEETIPEYNYLKLHENTDKEPSNFICGYKKPILYRNTAITINQYDQEDNILAIYTGTFYQVFRRIKKPSEYYYRLACLNTNTLRNKVFDKHFGVSVSCVGGLSFTIEDYLNSCLNRMVSNYSKRKDLWTCDFYGLVARYLWIKRVRECLALNTKKGFNEFINTFLSNNPGLVQVTDLREYNNVPGLYFMVLDEYKLCYIGQASKSIKTRVMRHWSRNDYFTGTGIDLYKAYDTTRLFAMRSEEKDINREECNLVSQLLDRYSLNCMTGGGLDYIVENNLSIVPDYKQDEDILQLKREQYSRNSEEIIKTKEMFIVTGD